MVEVRRIAGALGAEISGVDLSRELDAGAVAAIRAAFVEHQVVFFRDQTLTPEQHKRFGRYFGSLNIHPYVAGMADHPEIMEIIKEPGDKVNFGGGWHSDMSFLETPSIGSILYALDLPDWGGDTLFASQAAAYDALSPGLKATLEGLNAVHSAGREYSIAGHSAQKRQSMQVSAAAEGASGEFVHPVIKVHPRPAAGALRQPGLHDADRGLDQTRVQAPAGFSVRAFPLRGLHLPLPVASRLPGLLGQPLGLAFRPQRLSGPAPPHAPGDGGRRLRNKAVIGGSDLL